MQTPTIYACLLLCILYITLNNNNPFTTNQSIFYYISLSIVSYVAEIYSIFRNKPEYQNEMTMFESDVLMPLFIIPVAITCGIVFMYSMVEIVSSPLFILHLFISYKYRQEQDTLSAIIISAILTYLPLETISIHAIVLGTTHLVLL